MFVTDWGILRVCVFVEEQRSLEGVYRWRSLKKYCGPMCVITLNQTVKIVYCTHNGRNKILRTKTSCYFSNKHVSLLLIKSILYLSFFATCITISLPMPFTIFCIDQKHTLFISSQFLYENYARKTSYKQWIANQTQWALEKYICNAEEKIQNTAV